MSIVQWDESLSVNIDEIDQQHRWLIKTIAKLESSMRQGNSKAVLWEIFDELTNFWTIHFKAEEKVMVEVGYPDTENHLAEHKNFIRKIDAFKEAFQEDEIGLTVEMMNFLSDWVYKHIKHMDSGYAAYIAHQKAEHD